VPRPPTARPATRQRCRDAGMDAYLPKPVTREQLDASLSRWLRGAPAPRPRPPVADDAPSAPVPFVERDAPAPAPPEPAAETAPPAAEPAIAQLPPAPVLETGVLDELREIAGEEALSIVHLFLAETPRLIRRMEQASATPDLDAMREAAHALKSSAANVGALALSAAAKRIELGARANALDRPAVAVALLIAEFARARVALQGWLSASAGQSSSLLSR